MDEVSFSVLRRSVLGCTSVDCSKERFISKRSVLLKKLNSAFSSSPRGGRIIQRCLRSWLLCRYFDRTARNRSKVWLRFRWVVGCRACYLVPSWFAHWALRPAENFIPRDVVCCRPRKALEPKFWILNVGADKAESNHPTMIGRSKAKSYFRFVSFCFVPFWCQPSGFVLFFSEFNGFEGKRVFALDTLSNHVFEIWILCY